MRLADEFFLLVHNRQASGASIPSEAFHRFLSTFESEKNELIALLLSANVRNIHLYRKTATFIDICTSLALIDNKTTPIHIELFFALQLAALEYISTENGFDDRICETVWAQLRQCGALLYDEEQNLLDAKTFIEKQLRSKQHSEESAKKPRTSLNISTQTNDGSFFAETAHTLKSIATQLAALVQNDTYQEKLQSVCTRIEAQTFSIGITGVFNAGKSTMLNALLHKQVLGTSVVPETANLSILKYAKTESASVSFWTKTEWEEIVSYAAYDERIKTFVSQTKERFGLSLNEYVTDTGRTDEISPSTLPSYTSAKHSNGLCNLVKSVEIRLPLSFLQNGVEIVDTPGLDDPVIRREEITKEYVSRCDMMIHLMNTAQSATQKDVEFIIDALVYQNVSRLLIVMTRIDTVSEDDLIEAIRYTKHSIEQQLGAINKAGAFDELISKIDFIPLSGYFALLHRTKRAQEALKRGYSLEKTGIERVEAYLTKTLFGKESPKAKLVLGFALKEIKKVADAATNDIEKERSLLSLDNATLQKQLDKVQKGEEKAKESIEMMRRELDAIQTRLNEFIDVMEQFASTRLLQTKNLLKKRIFDDISYELQKGKKPNPNRLSIMIDTGLKDELLDLGREYRYRFVKKIDESVEEISERFASVYTDTQTHETVVLPDVKATMNMYLKNESMLHDATLLKKRVSAIGAHASKNNLSALELALEECFSYTFTLLSSRISQTISMVNAQTIPILKQVTDEPASDMVEQWQRQKEVIEREMANRTKTAAHREKRIVELDENEQNIADVMAKLERVKETL